MQDQRSSRSPGLGTMLLVLGAVVFGVVLAGSLGLSPSSRGADSEEQAPAAPSSVAASTGSPSFADLAEAVLPAVVSVRATTIASTEEEGGFFHHFDGLFGQKDDPHRDLPKEFRSDGAGSGFLVSSDGWIVTNYHVVEGATSVSVHFGDSQDSGRRQIEAEVHGVDPATDIAVLKIKSRDPLPYLALGETQDLRVGDWVMAIGSPLGLDASVTVGVVSAKGRSIQLFEDQSFESFIQTDAAINRGNSGGPLVNVRGEVVGISTAMNFGAENIGFAVPVDILKQVLPQLQSSGRVRRGYLGVSIDNLDYDAAKAFGLEDADGVLIRQVVAGEPADRAGLSHGDIVLRVDQHRVHRTRDLIDYVSSLKPGRHVEVEVIRNGVRKTIGVTLGERGTEAEPASHEPEAQTSKIQWMGIEVEAIGDEDRNKLGLPADLEGVLVTELRPSSPLYDAGVRAGVVISEVNGETVSSPAELEERVSTLHSGDYVRLYIYYVSRDGVSGSFAIVQVP